MVTQEQLKKLSEPIEHKYRLQSAKFGKATIVSYIDSRQVQDKFDEVCGQGNWKNEFKTIGDSLFCGISVNVRNVDGGSEWVTKWDVGTESNVDKEKGEVSDAMKRAAVLWGCGRFLYSLGMITLKTATHKEKEYPADDSGNILWGTEALTEYCRKVVASGELDRTKNGVKPLTENKKPTSVAPKPESKVTPKPTVASPTEESPKSAIQPNTSFDTDEESRKVKATEMYSQLDKAVVLKHLIKEEKMKYASVSDFIKGESIEKILEIYKKLTAK